MKKLIHLMGWDKLDHYHQRRLDRHGAIYFVVKDIGDGAIYEAKSLATGAVCTLLSRYCVEPANAVQEPQA